MGKGLKAVLHPNDMGPRFLFGKAYYWLMVDGRLSLRLWPMDENGDPVRDPWKIGATA